MSKRKPASSDYTFEVPNIGRFRYAKRTMKDEMRIGVEFSRITEGAEVLAPYFSLFATAIATQNVLLVEAPEGWDIDAMDPADDDTITKIVAVHMAFRDKERSFRAKSGEGSETSGPKDGQDNGVLVPATVQPPSE